MPQALDAPRLLRRHGIRPLKRFGQNFLIDRGALLQVVAAAELTGKETVLEVGAGLGALTRELAVGARRVIAIEVDRRLLPILREVLEGLTGVEILAADILEIDLGAVLPVGPYQVVANIPYNITSALIRRFLESQDRPERMVLTIQREVAERIVAGPGAMSLLAVSVQVFGVPKLGARIPAAAFYPRPEVDSAVLRIDTHSTPPFDLSLVEPVFRLAKAGFAQRRKMLKNTLAAGLGWPAEKSVEVLAEAKIRSQARPQELSLEDWAGLARAAIGLGLLEESRRLSRGDGVA